MLLQFCDKCGRPLSEGAIARGEAVERAGETICSGCMQREREQVRPAQPATETGPLGQYTQAVWHCESCGIPVNALDLIEGRASRAGARIKCVRCAPQPAHHAEPVRAAPTRPVPAAPAASAPATSAPAASAPVRAPLPPARSPIHARPGTSSVVQELIAEGQSAQRRPVLPILLFAIVLPMFAISLYFAITSQQKLNEAMAIRGEDEGNRPDRRDRRPQDWLEPTPLPPPRETGNTSYTPPVNGGTQPELPKPPAVQPAPVSLPAEAVENLLSVENELAAPVILQLQSKDLGEVWEGLIAAGSRRLITTRPWVRALLAEQHDPTRLLACRVAALLADTDALPQLTRMSETDPSEGVRTEALKARDRMLGEATRELADLSTAELEKMLRDLQRELERRK